MPAIYQMNRSLVICSSDIKSNKDGKIILSKSAILKTWGMVIDVRRPAFTSNGINTEKEYKSHVIKIRNRREYDFTIAAWAYEERAISSPRWYKIQSYIDEMDFASFDVALTFKDFERPPIENCGININVPNGIKI